MHFFFKRSYNSWGHIISHEGIRPNVEKIQSMLEWPLPTTLKGLRGCLGLTSYYRKLVRGYASIVAPLTYMLKKNYFQWNEDSKNRFANMKITMTTTPVLKHPDFTKEFSLGTDSSNSRIGVVLSQEGHTIAFFSAKLIGRLALASTYDKEMHAIIQAVKKWRHYLLGKHFLIHTNHHIIRDMIA